MNDRFELPDPSPFKFRAFDRELYREILSDEQARRAFRRLTSGRKAINPSELLFSIGTACCSTDPPANHVKEDEWFAPWKEKWRGLRAVANSLSHTAVKMRRHMEKSPWGPAPLAYMGADRWEKEYGKYLKAQIELEVYVRFLDIFSEKIRILCDVSEKWSRERPTLKKGISYQTIGLLFHIKNLTGKLHSDRIASLLNAGRRLRGHREVSGDALRKLWRLCSKDWPWGSRFRYTRAF
jgi:hypothetical protein